MPMHSSHYAYYVTDFIKDTSFLVVIAYLLTRGRLLRLLFFRRLSLAESFPLGTLLGLISLGVSSLPDIGFRYPCQTLFAVFSTLVGGLYVGLITAMISFLNTIMTVPHRVIETLFGVLVISPLAARLRRQEGIPIRLMLGFLAGALAQSCRILLHDALAGFWHTRLLPATAGGSIPISGFGVALLLLVVSDAQVRADSERRLSEVQRGRVEAEHAHALASEAQLAALRARIHPHFLFNALNSIAELCCIAPERAEAASLNLSQLMRRALETSVARTTTLREELTLVRAYLQIEQERLAERLQVVWKVDPIYDPLWQGDPDCDPPCDPSSDPSSLVPFSIQILVENAINHGLGPKVESGTLTVTIRRSLRHMIVAVRDDGVGMTTDVRRRILKPQGASTHGLQILDEQLRILYGVHSRLRLFSEENRGTLIAFILPAEATKEMTKAATSKRPNERLL